MKYYLTILFTLAMLSVNAQKVAIKTNLLYDATATANLGVEIGLGQRTTLDLSGNYNAWYTDKDANEKIRHFLFQPEFRYYTCEKLAGHFFGVHGLFTEYNINDDNWLLNGFQSASNFSSLEQERSRYEGSGLGVGISYGYDLVLSNRFNLEFSIGGGFIHFDYDRYGPNRCDPYIESDTKNYFGLTKLGISLVYIIK